MSLIFWILIMSFVSFWIGIVGMDKSSFGSYKESIFILISIISFVVFFGTLLFSGSGIVNTKEKIIDPIAIVRTENSVFVEYEVDNQIRNINSEQISHYKANNENLQVIQRKNINSWGIVISTCYNIELIKD